MSDAYSKEGLRWPNEQSGPRGGTFPLRDVVERGQQVGYPVEPDLAFPAAGRPLDHQHLVAGVGDALVLVGLDGLNDDLQLAVLDPGLAEGGSVSALFGACRRGGTAGGGRCR